MAEVSDDPKDVCACGDYREQHDERGWCQFNKPGNIGHSGAPDCYSFRLNRRAGPVTTEQLDILQFGKSLHGRPRALTRIPDSGKSQITEASHE